MGDFSATIEENKMAKLKFRDIKIQMNGKFNTNGTIHDTIESAFEYWDRKLPDETTTYLIYPKNGPFEQVVACFSLKYVKECLGVK